MDNIIRLDGPSWSTTFAQEIPSNLADLLKKRIDQIIQAKLDPILRIELENAFMIYKIEKTKPKKMLSDYRMYLIVILTKDEFKRSEYNRYR